MESTLDFVLPAVFRKQRHKQAMCRKLDRILRRRRLCDNTSARKLTQGLDSKGIYVANGFLLEYQDLPRGCSLTYLSFWNQVFVFLSLVLPLGSVSDFSPGPVDLKSRNLQSTEASQNTGTNMSQTWKIMGSQWKAQE